MRLNLLTSILLATILVEASCVRNPSWASPRLVESTIPGGCIIPRFTTGVRIVRSSSGSFRTGRSVPSGTRLDYDCINGYMVMNGSKRLVCTGGVWDETPRCWKTCSAAVSDSVEIVCRLWGEAIPCAPYVPPGTVASLNCKWPFMFPFPEGEEYRQINCQMGGTWSRPLYNCSLAF